MLLGVAWRDAGPEIDRMSRYESRLRVRYEKAIRRLDTLIASRPRLDEQEPAPTTVPPRPPSQEKDTLPNEPNFVLTSIVPTPPFSSETPVAPSGAAACSQDGTLRPPSGHSTNPSSS